MPIVSQIFIFMIATLHFYIMTLEMFLWTSPKTRKIFNTTEEFSKQTQILAANQWLYNGFLAMGLIISLTIHLLGPESASLAKSLAYIFLIFISLAGIYGGITSSKKIFFIQTIPAICAIGLLYLP